MFGSSVLGAFNLDLSILDLLNSDFDMLTCVLTVWKIVLKTLNMVLFRSNISITQSLDYYKEYHFDKSLFSFYMGG